jgi:hypothetical protein
MKKRLAVILFPLVLVGLAGCTDSSETQGSPSPPPSDDASWWKTLSSDDGTHGPSLASKAKVGGLSFDSDSAWREAPGDASTFYYLNEARSIPAVMTMTQDVGPDVANSEANLQEFVNSLLRAIPDSSLIDLEFTEINGVGGAHFKLTGDFLGTSEKEFLEGFTTVLGSQVVSITFACDPVEFDRYKGDRSLVFDSISTVSGEPNPLLGSRWR